MRLFGTREQIFDEAIRLISSIGYEAVNMRQLAENSGIRAPSIYNHFSSKQEILDSIYDYYEKHFLDNLVSDEKIKSIIEEGDSLQIARAFAFTFESADKRKYKRMVLITKIIYTRCSTDQRAGEIFYELMMNNRETHMKDMLDYGVSIGRFEPFDTRSYVEIFAASRHLLGIKAFARADYTVAQLPEEEEIIKMLASFLPLKVRQK